MSTNLYLVPLIGDGLTPATSFRPKYFGDGTIAVSRPWAAHHYPSESLVLVGAPTTPIEHAALMGKPDVVGLSPIVAATSYQPEVLAAAVGVTDQLSAAVVKTQMLAVAHAVGGSV